MWLNSSVWEYDFEKRKKNNHKESTNIKVQEKKKVITQKIQLNHQNEHSKPFTVFICDFRNLVRWVIFC